MTANVCSDLDNRIRPIARQCYLQIDRISSAGRYDWRPCVPTSRRDGQPHFSYFTSKIAMPKSIDEIADDFEQRLLDGRRPISTTFWLRHAPRIDWQHCGSSSTWNLNIGFAANRQALPAGRLALDDYLERYPELMAAPPILQALIIAEYRVRQTFADVPEMPAFLRRLPNVRQRCGRNFAKCSAGFVPLGFTSPKRPTAVHFGNGQSDSAGPTKNGGCRSACSSRATQLPAGDLVA